MTHTPTQLSGRSRSAALAETDAALESIPLDDGDDPARLVGRVLDQRYRLEAVLGAGAMAVVFSAEHVFLGKRVAVKVLHPAVLALAEVRERFQREARATSTVRHPRVVEVTDSGISDEGYHYLVMEHLEGEDLYAWTQGRHPLPIATLARIGQQLADGLAAIHRAGFVHRDLKPENIHVLAGGASDAPEVKILDLGIAALLAGVETGEASRLTRAHTTVGTVYYMSPEQAAGAHVDGRTDIYALGCVLWELGTGRLVFDAESQTEVLMRHVGEVPAPPSSLNPALPEWYDVLVLRCLEKKASARFQRAEEIASLLGEHLRDLEVETLPAPLAGGLEGGWFVSTAGALEAVSRRRWPYLLGLVGLAGVAAAIIATAVTSSPPDPTLSEVPPRETVSRLPGSHPTTVGESSSGRGQPAPPPEPSEPAPAQTTIRFDIDPVGATILRDGKPMGTSPLTLEVEAADTDVTYTFTHPGFGSGAEVVSHAENRYVALALVPHTPPEPSPAPAVAPRPVRKVRPPTPRSRPQPAEPVAPPAPAPSAPAPTDLWRPQAPGGAR